MADECTAAVDAAVVVEDAAVLEIGMTVLGGAGCWLVSQKQTLATEA